MWLRYKSKPVKDLEEVFLGVFLRSYGCKRPREERGREGGGEIINFEENFFALGN